MTDTDVRAWTRPEVEMLSEGGWRIPLPLPIDGLTTGNCYLFAEGDDVVLVDPGWASPDTDAALAGHLRMIGRDASEISRIVVTHTHMDHYGQAMLLRERHGIPVEAGEGERPSVESYRRGQFYYPEQVERLRQAGDAALADTMLEQRGDQHESAFPSGQPSGWLSDAQRIPLGDRELIAYATPGHTRGHTVFADPERSLLITGDHILPRITPSVGLEYRPEQFPLRSFLSSLARVRELPDGAMLPAHGNVGQSVHERIDELLAHHEGRFQAVLAGMDRGASTAAEVAASLTWTSREQPLDSLAPMHRMTAVLEVAAHLHVLEQRGAVVASTEGGVEHFLRVAGS